MCVTRMELLLVIRKKTNWWAWAGILVLAAGSFFAWQHLYPVQVSEGWSLRVFHDDIEMVSALVLDGEQLYVSQEFRNGRGVILKYPHAGIRSGAPAVAGLSKPDGMVAFDGGIVLSQEGGKLPVLMMRDGKTEPLFVADSAEGVASDGRNLFAIEDVKQSGRLLKFDPSTRQVSTLRDDLEEGEGVAVCPDGGLFYSEKKKGWIKRYRPGQNDDIVVRGLHDPSFLMCDGEGLWITEDLTHGARLYLLDAFGNMQTILTRLRSPQTIIPVAPSRFLLAEQGRGRILELTRLSGGTK